MIVTTRLWPHDCAHTCLCPHTFVLTHVCAQTDLCPEMIAPRYVSAQICLWPDMIMSLANNTIIIVSTRLIMCQLDWWKHKQLCLVDTIIMLLAKRSEMWLFNYCSAITSSIPNGIFRNFIITCQGTNMSGHKHVWAQTCDPHNNGYVYVNRNYCIDFYTYVDG